MVKTVNAKIFVCPKCPSTKKMKRFSNLKNLNIHLSIAHKSKYKIVLVTGSAMAKLRIKKH